LMISTGLAVYWAIEKRPTESALRGRAAMIGALCGLVLVFASVGSATSDRYMPSNTTPPGPGLLAWTAQRAQQATKRKTYRATTLPWIRREGLPAPASVPMSQSHE
jgi:hypothetical protein